MNSKLNCRWPLFPVRGVFSLAVQNLHIRSLGLRSLRSVSGGLVLLHNNSQLCYTSSLPWDSLLHPTEGPHRIVSHNQDAQLCGGLAHENAAPRSCKGPRGGWGGHSSVIQVADLGLMHSHKSVRFILMKMSF